MRTKEPLTWKPRLLDFEEAIALHDFEKILKDLQFAKLCFKLIADREYGVMFPYSPVIDDSFRAWCAFVSGGIYYRRCFKSGVRHRLHRADIVDVLANNEIDLHDDLIAVMDKHVSHSVNEMELGCTTIDVAIDSTGQLHRGGIGSRAMGAGPFGPAAYKCLDVIVDKISLEVVGKKIETLRSKVREITSKMPDDEILRLSKGFPPNIDTPRYNKPRNWPIKKGD